MENGTPFAFSVIADSRSGHQIFAGFMDDMSDRGARFNINGGDLVQFGGRASEWGEQFFDIANADPNGEYHMQTNFMATHPLFYAFADHETYGNASGDELGTDKIPFFFTPPGNGIPKTTSYGEHYHQDFTYAFAYGNVYFIFPAAVARYADITASQQTDWLEQQLTIGADYDYRIVVFHESYYNTIDSAFRDDCPVYWEPLFNQYDVTAVFMGNSHAFNDSIKNDVHYITIGGGGAELEPAYNYPGNADTYDFELIKAASIWHYAMVHVTSSSMRVNIIDRDGAIYHTILWGTEPVSTGTGTGTAPATQLKCRFTETAPAPVFFGLTTVLLLLRKKQITKKMNQ